MLMYWSALMAEHCVAGAYDGTVRGRGHVQMSTDIFILEFIVSKYICDISLCMDILLMIHAVMFLEFH